MAKKSIQKAATHQALIHALQEELLERERLTVEAIAARASVNKSLVYRYFGGLDGLIAAFAASDEFMPGDEEILQLCGGDMRTLMPRERFIRCIQAYVTALAQRPATVQILLRLPTFPKETIAALAEGRSQPIDQIRLVFGKEEPVPAFDRDLAFSLLISGACMLLGYRRDSWNREPIALQELSTRIVKMFDVLLQ
jgi:AcrR family transcriptional regulator